MGEETRYLRVREILILLGVLIIIDTRFTRVFPRSPQGQTLLFGVLAAIGVQLMLSGVRVKGFERFSVREKISAAVITGGLVVGVIYRSSLHYGVSVNEFIVIAFLSFFGLPLMYYVFKEEKSSDQGEKDMNPDRLTRMHRDDVEDNLRHNPWYHYRYLSNPDLGKFEERLKERQTGPVEEEEEKTRP